MAAGGEASRRAADHAFASYQMDGAEPTTRACAAAAAGAFASSLTEYPRTCCGKQFHTSRSFNGHVGMHPQSRSRVFLHAVRPSSIQRGGGQRAPPAPPDDGHNRGLPARLRARGGRGEGGGGNGSCWSDDGGGAGGAGGGGGALGNGHFGVMRRMLGGGNDGGDGGEDSGGSNSGEGKEDTAGDGAEGKDGGVDRYVFLRRAAAVKRHEQERVGQPSHLAVMPPNRMAARRLLDIQTRYGFSIECFNELRHLASLPGAQTMPTHKVITRELRELYGDKVKALTVEFSPKHPPVILYTMDPMEQIRLLLNYAEGLSDDEFFLRPFVDGGHGDGREYSSYMSAADAHTQFSERVPDGGANELVLPLLMFVDKVSSVYYEGGRRCVCTLRCVCLCRLHGGYSLSRLLPTRTHRALRIRRANLPRPP